jgi:hypothetical protein
VKRTIPLLITACVGLVLIASRFVPAAQSWGEVAAIWFDLLAAVAFVLGGGSLLKLHLKKISDRVAGWGYSAVTLLAFAATLFLGLGKIGAKPEPQQEFYGQSFVPLVVGDLPASTIVRVPGSIPVRTDGENLPLSVRRQLREENGQLVFHGWMTSRQKAELAEYQQTLGWQCTVERLFDASQPKPPLKGKIEYLADHSVLSARGYLSEEVLNALLALNGDERWNATVAKLFAISRREVRRPASQLPKGYQIPPSLRAFVLYDASAHELGIRGPMSTSVRDTLARDSFPLVHPMTAAARSAFRVKLDALGPPLTEKQAAIVENVLTKTWGIDKLAIALDEAGKAVAIERSSCELEQERLAAQTNRAAVSPSSEPKKSGPDQVLSERQRAELDHFAADPDMTVGTLAGRLGAAGPFNDRQQAALDEFFDKIPTIAEQTLDLCVKLLREAPLSSQQRDFLVEVSREQSRWRQTVGDLFVAAHVLKYPWSGHYNTPESGFGWMYEFVFKPLLATMFSLLAFYVASAAFRAFRAKNVEAILLLATAFIVLLGQTFAGYWLTAWIPNNSPLAPLKIRNLTAWVAVFLTAGNRAIMIGIALGVASTSLKILLGIDRSYLGRGGD